MFEVGKRYRFEVYVNDQSIYYTGKVTDSTSTHIKVDTIKGETQIILISSIVQAREVE